VQQEKEKRDVSVAGNNRVQKREAQSYLVTGANCLHTVRLEDAELAHDRATAWLRSVFCRSVLCVAKGHE
jgi:hypothetical protein